MRYRDWGNWRHTKAFRDHCKSVRNAVKIRKKSGKLIVFFGYSFKKSVKLTFSCLHTTEVYLYPEFDPIPYAPFPDILDYEPCAK